MEFGQGARQALPIFGHYMRSVYDDGVLNFYRGDFSKPNLSEEELNWDESVYQQELEVERSGSTESSSSSQIW